MQYNIIPFEVKLDCKAEFKLQVQSLRQHLQQVHDKRGIKGRIYDLASLLTIAVLAKLAGQNQIRGMAHWAKLRAKELCYLFDLPYCQMPHPTTWSRILGGAFEMEELEGFVANFLLQLQGAAKLNIIPERGSQVIAIDGKTLRGSISQGQTSHKGVHLMAAYAVEHKVVLAQKKVADKTNEIVAAPQLLAPLDLRGCVVVGDAMQCQRELSVKIRTKVNGGDYLWFVKENQPRLHQEIADLFKDEPLAKGHAPAPNDFSSAKSIDKGHGRVEKRVITVSSELAGYTDWPYLAQVFKLESWTSCAKTNKMSYEVRYGVTSLPRQQAGAARLLHIARSEWRIENSLHYRRDVTLGEDRSQLRLGDAPQANAILNNLVLGLYGRAGVTNVAEARRELSYVFEHQLWGLAS